MSVLTVKPKFLYPSSRQFPFDEVAEKIVKALEKRNWKVPGITVEFGGYGSGEEKYKLVRYITGENFKLHFCRVQGQLNKHLNDTAALYSIYIPMQSMDVYEDESGPTYILYVGDDWEADKEWFMNSFKVHAKLDKKPRRYLKYKGNTYKSRATKLVFTNDLDREYSPEGDEPREIDLEKKFEEIAKWLQEFVLDYILTFPEVSERDEFIPELIPYEGTWNRVFSMCNSREAKRILKGKKDPNMLDMSLRHAYFGSGRRLVPLGTRSKQEYPQIAKEGFIWCDVNQNITQNSKKDEISHEVYMEMGGFFESKYIVAIKLKYANDVYVADNAEYTEKRKQLFESIAPRDILTDEELDEAIIARGATIVPITKYSGKYKDPIVLIERELDFEEIEWISKVN